MTPLLESRSITSLKGVGPAIAEKLERLGIKTLSDLLFHLPIRYEDRTRLTPISALREGQAALVEGEIQSSNIVFGRRRSLICTLGDKSGSVQLRFFHFSKTQQNILKTGQNVRCFGDIRKGATGPEMIHPEFQVGQKKALDDCLTPVYPVTEGLQQARFRNLITQVIELMKAGLVLPELLPEDQLPGGITINKAIRTLHQPDTQTSMEALTSGQHPAQQRLAFEELLAQRLGMRMVRERGKATTGRAFRQTTAIVASFLANLPFTLTTAQQKVLGEIGKDLQNPWPMMRLLQGDVGSGKTIIAAQAAVYAVENGLQAVIMAPTEILAEQHFLSLSGHFDQLGIRTSWLAGRVKGKQRTETLSQIQSGTAQIIIGTHALFQDGVEFHKLGLVVIDEQHRFGVHQRLALKAKGEKAGFEPHQLVMTATPIPRTLTMSLYADMDCSIIDELPPGRTPITTSVLPDNRRDEVISRVEDACLEGRQAYWVCTLIDESEALQCQAAEVTSAALSQQLSGLNVGLIHGRMTGQEKSSVMDQFKKGEINLLVATTVIEVGVDVPNASLMIIENPERLGLAQLHQLRGRVGRGAQKSHCVLLYQNPLGRTGRKRLNVIRESNDGFNIAEQDLRIRGPGEVLGSKQSGSLNFRIADLGRDAHLLPAVSVLSEQLLTRDPGLVEKIVDRWIHNPDEVSRV